nr:uncharacterized protein LOC131781604 [Pocillopora verrucosa]
MGMERYLQNSSMDPSEGSSLEEIFPQRIATDDQGSLSDREVNEIYQDVLGISIFEPVIIRLCPKEGPITGGTEFLICLNVNGIPENVASLRALFKGVGFADLKPVIEGVYAGRSPASEILGKVAVTVGSPDGTWNSLDETEFEYHRNVTQELQKLISKMPDTKRNIPLDYQTLNPSLSAGTVCSPSSSLSVVDKPLMADESMESDDDQSSYFADDETSICQSPSASEFSIEDECIKSKCELPLLLAIQ